MSAAPRPQADRLPLSMEQRALWHGQEFFGLDNPAYVITGRYHIDGPFDPGLLDQALDRLLARNRLLRCVLRRGDPEPFFECAERAERTLGLRDLSTEADPDAAAEALIRDGSRRPFAFFDAPLHRYTLLRLGAQRHILLISHHHILCDAWGAMAAFSELAAIYTALAEGREPGLPDYVDYAEYIAAQEEYLASRRHAEDEAFWRGLLEGMAPEPFLAPLPGRRDEFGNIGRLSRPFPPELLRRLEELARAGGASLAAVVLAATALLAARLCGRDTVLAGMPVLNRRDRRMRRILGHTTRLLPLPVRVDMGAGFARLCAETGRLTRLSLRHAAYPAEELAGALGLRLPCGHVADLVVNHMPEAQAAPMGPARTREIQAITGQEPKILCVTIWNGREDAAEIFLDHSLNHLDRAAAGIWLDRLLTLLRRAAEEPERPCGELDILLPGETALLARACQGPARPWMRDPAAPRRIEALFEAVAAARPGDLAVADQSLPGGGLTYAQLDAAANRVARALRAAGVRAGEPVAVVCGRTPELPAAALGVWKAGAAYLPVDPAYPARRRDFMLADAGVRTALLYEAAEPPPGVAAISPADIAAQPGESLPEAPRADPAYVVYTSGSTGRPKGVALGHAGFLNMILGQIELFSIAPQDRVLLFASPSFDASLSELCMALLRGAAVCPAGRALIDAPWELLRHMRRHGVSVATLPPSYLRLFEGAELPGLRVLITAGEPPQPADARRYAARLAYFNAYGPTEVSVCATAGRVRPEALPGSGGGPVSMGGPLPGVGAHVLDARLQPVPPGVPGELCVSGPGLALGYLGLPELTAERFVAAPWDARQRLYRTGDLVRLNASGEFEHLGRLDQQVKVRGHRVEPGEIEALLMEHPAVLQAAVLPEAATPGGLVEGLAAFVTLRPGQTAPGFAELRAWLSGRLPEALLPRRVAVLDAWPLTASGKVDRKALAALPPPASTSGANEALEGTAAAVAALWAELLPGGPFGPHDDFFARGGDSLAAIRLAQRLRERFGADLAARAVFAAPTLAGLTALVEAAAPAPDDALDKAPNDAINAPMNPEGVSAAQAGLLAVQQTSARPEACNMPAVFLAHAKTPGGLDPERWEAALWRLIARHESLRSGFVLQPESGFALQPKNGFAVQADSGFARIVAPRLDFRLERRDLRGRENALEQALDLASARCHQPFAVDRPPLVRAGLLRLDEARAVFFLCLHHALADGESLDLLLRELVALLDGRGPSAAPSTPAWPFGRMIAEERARLASPQAEAQRAFWLEALTPAPPPLDLATDFPRPAARRNAGARLGLDLDAGLVRGLEALARSARTGLPALLTALVQTLLLRRTGARDLVVGLPASTRSRPEHARCVGFCVNTLPLRCSLDPAAAFLDHLETVRETLGRALAHAAYPFERICRDLGLRRDPGRTPLFEALAAVESAPGAQGASVGLEALDLDFRAAKCDLAFLLTIRPDGSARLHLDYDADLFLPATAAGLLDELAGLARAALAEPRMRLGADARPRPAARLPAAKIPAVQDAVPPRSEPLAAVLRAFAGVLGREAGPRDDFFGLGGDSIRAIQVCGRLRAEGWRAEARSLFERPRPVDLAAVLTPAAERPLAPEGPGGDPEEAGLTPLQLRAWQGLPPGAPGPLLELALRTPPELDAGRLEAALLAVARNHDALRLRFVDSEDGRGPLMRPGDAAQPYFMTRPLAAGREPLEALRQAIPELRSRIDPRRGRLLAAAFLTGADGAPGLLHLAASHLVMDGLSWRILLEDLAVACRLGPAGLPRPTGAFLAWAAGLRSRASGPEAEAERAYWRAVCAGPSAALPLKSNGSSQQLLRRTAIFPAAPGRAERLAALGLALGRMLDAAPGESLLVALEGHGREAALSDLDLSRSVGWFTSEQPFRLPLADPDGLPGLARRVAEAQRAAPANGARFALLAEADRQLAAPAQLGFNDHGRAAAPEPFGLLPHTALPPPEELLPGSPPLHLILTETDAGLEIALLFCADLLDPAWAEALLARYLEALAEAAPAGPPGPASPEAERSLPLTPAQEGMCFTALSEPGTLVYVQQLAFRLRGEAEAADLARAWALTAARHESLCARFASTPEGAMQRIQPTPQHEIAELDLSALPEAEREAELAARLAAEAARPLDIERGPTLRALVVRLGAQEHVLAWSFHHILMDGWCIAPLLGETLASHAALRRGDAPQPSPAPRLAPYFQWLAGRDREADRRFWRGYLAGREAITPLIPAHCPTPAGSAQAGPAQAGPARHAELRLDAGARTSQALAELARRSGVTPSALIQAAWALVLARQTDARDVVFGLVTSGREADAPGMERLIGVFIRTVPVRVRLDDPAERAPALARRIQADAAARLPHESLPLAEIQQLGAGGAHGGELFDHLLLFENYPTDLAGDSGGLSLAGITGVERLPYAFGLSVLPGETLGFRLSFDESRLSRRFVEALGRRWLHLLDALAAAPEAPGLALPLLPEAERERLLRLGGGPRRDWPAGATLPGLFAAQVRAAPGATAIVAETPSGELRVSYAALAARAGQLAARLKAAGAGPDRPVAVCLERGPELVAGLLAAMSAGAPYVPLDPLYPAARLGFIIEDSGAALLLAEAATAGALAGQDPTGVATLIIDSPPLDGAADALPWDAAGEPGPACGPDDLAYVIYTSGSTGRPKGVEVTHAGLANFLLSMAEAPGFSSADTLLAVTTVCFDIAGLELFLPLVTGGRVVIAGREDAADAGRLAALLERHRPTVLQATPSTWDMLAASGWRGGGGLKALCGGEALPPRLARELLARCAGVWNLYGPTETTIWSTARRLEPGGGGAGPRVSVGSPIANTTAYVLGRDLELLPEGAAGELCLGGAGLARGYRNRPELTAERFATLPFAPFERVYRTGDLAAWTTDGELDCLGRADFQLKLRGLRIEPGEIEARLLELPGVRQAAVMAGDWRGAGPELAAWIAGGDGLTEADLTGALRRSLPHYMLPALYVRLPSLPRTPNGKLDRKALPPPCAPETPRTDGALPRTPTERAVAEVFEAVLERPGLGREDDFFRCGGHSLQAMRIISLLRERLGRGVELLDFLAGPTVAAVAARLDATRALDG